MDTISEFRNRLEGFLAAATGKAVRVTAVRQLTGGASRESWAVDADTAGERLALVVRRDMGGVIQEEALTREQEFRVLQAAHNAGVLVPQPRWVCSDPTALGVPFFVMDRLEGESVGRRVVKEPTLAAGRHRLPEQMGEQLARIHAIDAGAPDLAFLPRPDPGSSPAETALGRTDQQLQRLGEPHPVLELAIRWLMKRLPPCPAPVLVHGDFRIGNVMVGPDGLRGVFDWEFAHVGDPAEDLAWPCVRSWRFGQDGKRFGGVGSAEEFFAAYEQAGGRPVGRRAIDFWEIMGNLRWAVGCIAQADRHLSGQAPSVELASLGRRTAEMELELLGLMERHGD